MIMSLFKISRSSIRLPLSTQIKPTSSLTSKLNYSSMQNDHGQGMSHATGDSKVPQAAQEKLPKGVEESVPDSLHDTGSSKSHATGDSIVPEPIQKAVPKKLEEVLPNAIHDTSK